MRKGVANAPHTFCFRPLPQVSTLMEIPQGNTNLWAKDSIPGRPISEKLENANENWARLYPSRPLAGTASTTRSNLVPGDNSSRPPFSFLCREVNLAPFEIDISPV
jgi:hypothetical protein